MNNYPKIAIITPVRNEEIFIENAITCMLAQTIVPDIWVIVNDGSTDTTSDIIKKYTEKKHFIKLIELKDRGKRLPGAGVIEAFYEGLKTINVNEYDVIAKFDADLEFPNDMITKIKMAFESDLTLGITGGVLFETTGKKGEFKKEIGPDDFIAGPNKFYRRQCLEDMGGLIRRTGWDGVDHIKAKMKGWKVQRLNDVHLKHMRIMGSAPGEGLERAFVKYGDVSYYMGGYLWYFFLRILGRSIQSRNPLVGIHMVRGFLYSMLYLRQRETKDFRRYLKSQQMNNMKFWIRTAWKKSKIHFQR